MFRRRRESSMTLLELLMAMSVIVLIAGTLSGLAVGVQQGYDYAQQYGIATQHGRVALERITRTVSQAIASEQFPGFLVLAETQGQWRFPDTLVVWRPTGAAADPNGRPRFNELVIYCPDVQTPNRLLEITAPGDARVTPPADDTASWKAEVAAIRNSPSTQKVVLTDLLRTCTLPETSPPQVRGAVRFESRLRPSESEWGEYKAGTIEWKNLSWVQYIYGNRAGLRQAWMRMEMQIAVGRSSAGNLSGAGVVIPFFGSAAVYYQLWR
jgi:type II secretory pathway pseudopilin PulG